MTVRQLVPRILLAVLVATLKLQAQSGEKTMQQPVFYRTVKAEGLSIFYREAGPQNAPTLLLLHGLPSSSRMFQPLLARLADKYHDPSTDKRFGVLQCNPPYSRYLHGVHHGRRVQNVHEDTYRTPDRFNGTHRCGTRRRKCERSCQRYRRSRNFEN